LFFFINIVDAIIMIIEDCIKILNIFDSKFYLNYIS